MYYIRETPQTAEIDDLSRGHFIASDSFDNPVELYVYETPTGRIGLLVQIRYTRFFRYARAGDVGSVQKALKRLVKAMNKWLEEQSGTWLKETRRKNWVHQKVRAAGEDEVTYARYYNGVLTIGFSNRGLMYRVSLLAASAGVGHQIVAPYRIAFDCRPEVVPTIIREAKTYEPPFPSS